MLLFRHSILHLFNYLSFKPLWGKMILLFFYGLFSSHLVRFASPVLFWLQITKAKVRRQLLLKFTSSLISPFPKSHPNLVTLLDRRAHWTHPEKVSLYAIQTLSAASTSLTESTCELARLSIANSSTSLSEWWMSELLLVVSSPTLWTLSHTSSSGWMKPLTRPCKRRQRVGHESILSSSTQRTIGRWESQSSELSVLACKLAA